MDAIRLVERKKCPYLKHYVKRKERHVIRRE